MADGVAREAHELRRNGFVILPGVLGGGDVEALRAELGTHLVGRFGRNEFEGTRTERVYALLAKSPSTAMLVEHPRVLELVDGFLQHSYLLWGALAINTHPGETAQAFHADDDFVSLPRPRDPAGVSVMWALDDFTDRNGATELIPRSHLWDDRQPAADDPTVVRAVMPAGSALVWLGPLYHRGGAHRGSDPRLGVTVQYCQPWLRQVENMVLAVPPEMAARYSDRIQRMLGYGLWEGTFMGYVDGRDPKRLVDGSPGSESTVAFGDIG